MATTKGSNFEAGHNGDPILLADAGPGQDAASTSSQLAGLFYDTGSRSHGTQGMLVVPTSGAASFHDLAIPSSSPNFIFRGSYKMDTISAVTQIGQFRSSLGAICGVTRNGNILNFIQGDTAGTGIHNSPTLTPGHSYTIRGAVISNATTGKIQIVITDDADNSVVDTFTSTAPLNTRGGNVINGRWGKITANAVTDHMRFDDALLQDNTQTLPALLPVNTAPTADSGAAQTAIEPGNTVTENYTVSVDPDGTIATYNPVYSPISPDDLDTTIPARPKWTARPTIGGYTQVVSLTVTDNNGAVSPGDTNTYAVMGATEQSALAGTNLATIRRSAG